MNAHAHSNEFPPLEFEVDDAQRGDAALTAAGSDADSPEPSLSELPTLPRFPAKAARPATPDAANAPTMPAKLELALEPIDAAPPPESRPAVIVPTPINAPEPVPAPAVATAAATVDRYLAEATRELDAGQVDQPLWMHAITKANGDEAAARATYLKARATAIRMAKRETRHERAERRMRVIGELDPGHHGRVHGRGFADLFTPKRLVAAIATCGIVVVAGVWFALGDSAPAPAAVASAKADARPAADSATAPGQTAVPSAPAATPATPEKSKSQAQELAAKVKELSAAGNWNVLVLHATEWTRKDPDNPDAWLALGTGFVRLKQHYDAGEALARAAALAPERPETWRALGEAKAAWGATDEAIAAYERAVTMDDRDIASLVEVGLLQAGKGDHAKAKDTLDRALALNAADVEALCAAATVAHKSGRAKDAQGHAQKAKSLGAECPAAAPEPPPTPVRVVGGKQPPATPANARR